MCKEDYVSFEIAKLLKEKGFDVPIISVWIDHSKLVGCPAAISIYPNEENWNGITDGMDDIYFSAPTLQMAMKWLRKIHNIHIAIVPCEVGAGVMDYTYILYKVDTENFIFKNLEIQGRANTDKMSVSKTCEAAIKYCLENLI